MPSQPNDLPDLSEIKGYRSLDLLTLSYYFICNEEEEGRKEEKGLMWIINLDSISYFLLRGGVGLSTADRPVPPRYEYPTSI